MNLYHFVNVSNEHVISKADFLKIFLFYPGKLPCCLLCMHREYIADGWEKYYFLFFGNKLIGKDRLTKHSLPSG